MDEETILYDVTDNVAKITMNRPHRLNSFTEKMHLGFIDVLKKASMDPAVRSIVITGAGKAFNAGQDLSEVSGTRVDYGGLLRKRYNPLIERLQNIEKPVIAAVNGAAAGAGMSLALACDIRLVSEKATFHNVFIHIGLIPDSGGCYFLPRIVGIGKAFELAVTGDRVTADEAFQLGLANHVFPIETFDQDVMAYAARLAKSPTKGIGLIKRTMMKGLHKNLTEALEYEAYAQEIASQTEDHQEGLQAFLEKRPPVFRGN